MSKEVVFEEFLKNVKNSFLIFQNFTSICVKSERDGYLLKIATLLDSVMNDELKFAIKRDFTRNGLQKGP